MSGWQSLALVEIWNGGLAEADDTVTRLELVLGLEIVAGVVVIDSMLSSATALIQLTSSSAALATACISVVMTIVFGALASMGGWAVSNCPTQDDQNLLPHQVALILTAMYHPHDIVLLLTL